MLPYYYKMTYKYSRRKISNCILFVALILFAINFTIFRYKMRDMLEAVQRHPNEMGTPVHLPSKIPSRAQELIKLGWKNYKFNQYVSDMIPVNRSLPDFQDEWCKQPGRFLKDLPVTDVIICFHNEAWSTLLRTVHSVINRSPEHLIGQIILVDDFSNMTHLKRPLRKYFSTFPKVVIVRAKKREGIIRARLLGMKYSTAQVLTYLDSHCECTEGWLEPLLDRIARNSTTVVSPFIDTIDRETFEFLAVPFAEETFLGGFSWLLEYTWFQPSIERKKRHKNDAEPYLTPTIAGGLFAIDRTFFEHLGTYDSSYEYWGAENLELSFKVWMCGGRLEMVFCSRVGHVFRNETPYNYPSAGKVITKNLIRLAAVWLDDYAHIFYTSLGRAFNVTAALSDVSERKQLRKNLGCKSFKWYLENVYAEKFVPAAMGAIVQRKTNMCLDANDEVGDVKFVQCRDHGGSQFWMISNSSELRKDEVCLTVNGTKPVLLTCTKDDAKSRLLYNSWTYQISNKVTKQCLSSNRKNVFMEKCEQSKWRQQWALI